MKQPKLNDLMIDRKGTRRMRAEAKIVRKVKITINIDQDSLDALRAMAGKSGASYQKLLNQVLREGLKKRDSADARLDRIERELEQLKRKRVA